MVSDSNLCNIMNLMIYPNNDVNNILILEVKLCMEDEVFRIYV
jgi:hypothetical protein